MYEYIICRMIGLVLRLYKLIILEYFVLVLIKEINREKLSKIEIGGLVLLIKDICIFYSIKKCSEVY
jgi:hypothetical protein